MAENFTPHGLSDDELSVEELEDVAGGDTAPNQGCGPNTNCFVSCSRDLDADTAKLQ